MNTTPDTFYAKRASDRLRKLLDEQGYPMDAPSRCAAFARQIEITEASAERILSGKYAWDWASVQMMCAAFGREPGYFLDSWPSEGLPSDARLVTSVAGGESIVWRMPGGFSGSAVSMSSKLRYLVDPSRAAEDGTIAFQVFEQRLVGPGDLVPGTNYMVETDAGHAVMKFVSITRHLAVFSGPRGMGEAQIAMSSNDEPEEAASLPRVAGKLLGTISLPIR